MDIRALQYFVTVAEELNITKAAEKLMMSQPPLSLRMQQLEQELETTLFIRGKRHLQLTEEGSLLLRRARQILELEEKTRDEIMQMKNGLSGRLYLAMVEGRAPTYVARFIAGFSEEFPAVKYDLWNGSTDEALDRVKRGLADLAVIAAPYNTEDFEGLQIAQEPWVALLPAEHPLAKLPGESIALEKLADVPLVIPGRKMRGDAIRRWFEGIGKEPRFLCATSNYIDALSLSAQGVGVAIFPRTLEKDDPRVTVKTITDPKRLVQYLIVWEKNRPLNPVARAFLEFAGDTLQAETH